MACLDGELGGVVEGVVTNQVRELEKDEVEVVVGGEAVGLADAEEDSGAGDLEGVLGRVSLDEWVWE